MKLLLITAVKEFEKDIKQLLKKSGVQSFSYQDVKGFKNSSGEAVDSNWFGSELNETQSVLFYAFTATEKLDVFCQFVNEFNTIQESQSNIHVAVLNIEKTN
jgi:hypothetical protein